MWMQNELALCHYGRHRSMGRVTTRRRSNLALKRFLPRRRQFGEMLLRARTNRRYGNRSEYTLFCIDIFLSFRHVLLYSYSLLLFSTIDHIPNSFGQQGAEHCAQNGIEQSAKSHK